MGMGPVSGRKGGRNRTPMAEINVTPMVDVMLVLLIIFMVAAPLLVTGVPIDLPESRASSLDQDQEPVQISLDGAGGVFINDEEVAPAALPNRLEQIAREQDSKSPRQIYLRADRDLDYGSVAAVMGELNKAGLNRIALVTTGAQSGAQNAGEAETAE